MPVLYWVRTERFPTIFELHAGMFIINTLYHDPFGWVVRVSGQGGDAPELERVGMGARPGRTQFGCRPFARAWGVEPGGWVGYIVHRS